MFVNNSMTHKVITIPPGAGVPQAREIMDAHRIRHLPVVTADRLLVGIVTDRDIRSAQPSAIPGAKDPGAGLAHLRIEDIMTCNPVTVTPLFTIQDALLLIQEKRVGAFPVVDDEGVLKGIISVRDLLRAFINVLGIGEPGTLLCIIVEEKIGQLKKIVDTITAENISFGSILVARYWDKNKRAVFPYLLTLNVGQVKKKLRTMGYTLLDPMDWYLDQLPQALQED